MRKRNILPRQLRQAFCLRLLEPGMVFRLVVPFTHPKNLLKRVVVLGYDTVNVAVVVINSQPGDFVNCHPLRRRAQLHLPVTRSRTYLDWDSTVDCSQVFLLERRWFENKILARPYLCIGDASGEIDRIIWKIQECPLIPNGIKERFASLS